MWDRGGSTTSTPWSPRGQAARCRCGAITTPRRRRTTMSWHRQLMANIERNVADSRLRAEPLHAMGVPFTRRAQRQSRGGLRDVERHDKPRTGLATVLDPDVAAVALDQAADDGQPDAAPGRRACVTTEPDERLPDPMAIGAGNARPLVLHAELRAGANLPDVDPNYLPRWAILERVVEEVHYHLTHRPWVHEDVDP